MIEEKDLNESTSLTSLEEMSKNETALTDQILRENDVDKLKDLTHLFNAYQTKRQVLRINALNDVQDSLVQQMRERLNKRPDNFDNTDLANWMKTVQQVMDSSQKNIEQVDTIPAIINQQNNQINVNVDATPKLSRDSREKVLNVIQTILKNCENTGNSNVYDLEELGVYKISSQETKNFIANNIKMLKNPWAVIKDPDSLLCGNGNDKS